MATRAKFIATEKLETQYGVKFTLVPVTSGSKENEEFFKTTPSGQITIGLKRELGDLFQINKNYYVDFTEVGE